MRDDIQGVIILILFLITYALIGYIFTQVYGDSSGWGGICQKLAKPKFDCKVYPNGTGVCTYKESTYTTCAV